MPNCNLIIWYCKDFDALGTTPLTPLLSFHISGVNMEIRRLSDYLPSTKFPNMGGTTVLNEEINIDCSFLFRTFTDCN